MPRPCLKVYLEIDTSSHRDTILADFELQLVGKDVVEMQRPIAGDLKDRSELSFIVWLRNRADRDAIRDWIRGRCFTNPVVKKWVEVARISWHLCSHQDSEVRGCKETSYELVEK